MPYRIALESSDDSSPFWVLDNIIDFMFLCDVFVNFNSPLELGEGIKIYDRKIIALTYLKAWFFIDLTACVPINII